MSIIRSSSSAKKCVCILSVTPHSDTLSFLKEIKANTSAAGEQYDVYLLCDDSSQKYEDASVKILQIDDLICEEQGFKNMTPNLGKPVTSWDKAMYLFHQSNVYEHYWFIEDDVFIPHANTLASIDQKHAEADLLARSNITKKDYSLENWHWWKTLVKEEGRDTTLKPGYSLSPYPLYFDPPFYRSMCCAVRVSHSLLEKVGEFSKEHQSLCFLEFFFNSLSMKHGLRTETPKEFDTVLWKNDWLVDDIKRDKLYHPIKDIDTQARFRQELDRREGLTTPPPKPAEATIQMFWHGALSLYEVNSLRSFVEQGHPVDLYSYQEIDTPAGVRLMDAREIIPESLANQYLEQDDPPLSTFANLFRYKLLFLKGGIWMDTDFICLRPIRLEIQNWCCRESENMINNAALHFEAGHPLAQALYDQALAMGSKPTPLSSGPYLLTKLAPQFPDVTILGPRYFYPIHWNKMRQFFHKDHTDINLEHPVYAVHWWSSIVNRMGISTSLVPPEGCWIHQFFSECDNAPKCSEKLMNTWLTNSAALGFRKRAERLLSAQCSEFETFKMIAREHLKNGSLEAAEHAANLALKTYSKGPFPKLILLETYILREDERADALIEELSHYDLGPEMQNQFKHLQFLQKKNSRPDTVLL